MSGNLLQQHALSLDYLLSIWQISHVPANPSFLPQPLSGRGWHRFLCCFLAYKTGKTNTVVAEAFGKQWPSICAVSRLWSQARCKILNTRLYMEVSKRSLVTRGQSKNLSFQEKCVKKLPTPKYFLQLENCFMVVVPSCDLRLQEATTCESQLSNRPVPAKLLLWPHTHVCSSSPTRSSGISGGGAFWEREVVCHSFLTSLHCFS